MIDVKKLVDAVKEAKTLGFSKIKIDGVDMVVCTQKELDRVIEQAKEEGK